MHPLPAAREVQVDRTVDELHDQLRARAGGVVPLPVDLHALAAARGLRIEVVESGLAGGVLANRTGVPVSGAIDFASGRIYVNGRERNEGRRRFTIAHELAHELLGHEAALGGGMHVVWGGPTTVVAASDSETGAPQGSAGALGLLEAEADHAAGRMLVPPAELDMAIAELGVASVPLLATRFGTSTQAMQVRIRAYLPRVEEFEPQSGGGAP